MNNHVWRDLLFGVIFVFLDVLFFSHLTVFGLQVDPLLFYILWLIPRYDRLPLLLITAVLAFLQDAAFDYWGMMMFSKTLLIFVIFNPVKARAENQLLIWQIFIFIFSAAIIHNLVFYMLASFFIAYAANFSPFILVLGNAIYTAIVGCLIYIFRIR